ncbi:hypothetical protein ACFXK0_03565 [Nocardia sp. NPDC059177]|uniref:hypothetical protein n=1 Tax=Nocardia sp. NPDC059177 TaxID=3346759 RepID=UPI0036BF028E
MGTWAGVGWVAAVGRVVDAGQDACGFVVIAAGHATLPRRGRRAAGCLRVVASVVVVVPMSGFIVAHHASCTRRDPRIPPVR